jgi:hypothetical protein
VGLAYILQASGPWAVTISALVPQALHIFEEIAMGFRPEPTVYNLSFQGTQLDGLHVKMSCCTIKEHNEMMKAAMQDGIDEETLKSNDRILDLFTNHLVSWDLEDLAGQIVPTTREGIDDQERTIIVQLINAWQVAMMNIPNPSNSESSNGSISEEQSLGLGSISESPGNLVRLNSL